MSSVASRWASWEKRGSRIKPTGGSATYGAPFLTSVYGAQSKLIVEWAPGANLNGSPDLFPWQDITSDVMQADGGGISITIGRSDEYTQAQPASCSFRLKNIRGDYSKGPQSIYYPNVKRNVPIRVSVDIGTGKFTRFYGYATSFQPSWDVTGGFAVVDVSANGITRRLAQGTSYITSPMRYYIENTTSPTVGAYWPCEDSVGSTAIAGGTSKTLSASETGLTFANNSIFSGSMSLPTFSSTGTVSGVVSTSFTDNQWQWDWHCYLPSDPGSDTLVMQVAAGGTVNLWQFYIATGGGIKVVGTSYSGGSPTTVVNDFFATSSTPFGRFTHWEFSVQQSGGNTNYHWIIWPTLGGNSLVSNTSSFSGTPGNATSWTIPASANLNGFSLGHVVYYDAYNFTQAGDPAFGWNGSESTGGRLGRLCNQINVQLEYKSSGFGAEIFGAQTTDTFMNVVRETETTDQGILYDGLNPGFNYLAFRARENASEFNHSIVVDVSKAQLTNAFLPYDDDQRNRNYYVVTRKNGSSATYEDSTSALGDGTNGIGRYDSSLTINTTDDTYVLPMAQWLVHVGTDDSMYRYPELYFNFANPEAAVLANDWLSSIVGARITLTNITGYISQFAPNSVRLLVEGWTEFLSTFAWNVKAICGPEQPWRIIELAADAGDTNEYICHLDANDGDVTVSGEYVAGATSITVNVNVLSTGISITTNSDDVPFDLNIGGWQITVTSVGAVSGNQQILTVNAIPGNIHNGTQVNVWKPPVIGRG